MKRFLLVVLVYLKSQSSSRFVGSFLSLSVAQDEETPDHYTKIHASW